MMVTLTSIWPQPLDPLHSVALSALVAALPLILILVLMGGLRKSGLFASLCGLGATGLLAILVWHMYHVLFAPGTYPMNFAWWDGRVSKNWQEEEHPLDANKPEEPEVDETPDAQDTQKDAEIPKDDETPKDG